MTRLVDPTGDAVGAGELRGGDGERRRVQWRREVLPERRDRPSFARGGQSGVRRRAVARRLGVGSGRDAERRRRVFIGRSAHRALRRGLRRARCRGGWRRPQTGFIATPASPAAVRVQRVRSGTRISVVAARGRLEGRLIARRAFRRSRPGRLHLTGLGRRLSRQRKRPRGPYPSSAGKARAAPGLSPRRGRLAEARDHSRTVRRDPDRQHRRRRPLRAGPRLRARRWCRGGERRGRRSRARAAHPSRTRR